MSRETVTRIVALVLAVLLPSTSVAQLPSNPSAITPKAMLTSQGDVSVNGKKVPNSIALFVGDRVQTGDSSVATLTAKDASILIYSRTSLVYGGNYVEVGCGSVALSLSGTAMDARVQNLVITPTSESSKIEITKMNGKLEIGAREGTLTVDDGTQKVQVETGKSLNFENAGECNRKAAAVPPGGGAPSPLHVSNALLYGIGAGAAGGILFLLLNAGGGSNGPAVSTTVP